MKKATSIIAAAVLFMTAMTTSAQTPWWTRGNSTVKNAGLATNHQIGTQEAVPFSIITNNTARATFSASGKVVFTTDSIYVKPTGGINQPVLSSASVSAVTPTSPNRTIKVVISGTTYYIAAKTTND